MTGENYALALALAKNDKDLLEDIHEILMESGISDETYAKVFARMYYAEKESGERISYDPAEKEWRRSGHTLSDIRIVTELGRTCDLIHAYAMASWDNCVFSAWVSKKEVQKAEEKMSAMESLTHAKTIFSLASELMPSIACSSSRVDWTTDEEETD